MSVVPKSVLRARDVAEIAIGSCIMGFPIAVTEEVWNLGEELSLLRVVWIALASILVLALLIWVLFQHGEPPENRQDFVRRVLTSYGVTLVICASMLFAIDRLELTTDLVLGLKRTILVAFPASFAATAVDSLGG